MWKYIIGAIVVIILIIGGYFLSHRSPSAPQPEQNTPTAQQPATSTYATTTFSIVYPNDFSVHDAYQYTQVNPKKPISGVKFTIPAMMATGTNLASDSYVSVEWLPRANKCTGDIYLAANVRAEAVNENGVSYSIASSTGAAAGNQYEEWVFALAGSKPCTAVRYFIHSSNIGNYEPGAVNEFDRTALLNAFDAIRHSLLLTSGAAAPSTSTTP